jgi:cytochrome P450
MVIARMIGIPADEWQEFRRWSDTIMRLSYSRQGQAEKEQAMAGFASVTAEMGEYVGRMIRERRSEGRDDLLSRLVAAEVAGQRLTQEEILGFFQLLIVGGQETTANLINNAMLCFMEHPEQLARVRGRPELLPAAVEEVLRYRSPLQWVMRVPTREVELHGKTLRPGELVLPMIGSANRDARAFVDAERFDVCRDPNPHVAFGHGIHFCMGAMLARMEARVALGDLLGRLGEFRLASDEPWEPRQALNVHGPARLEVRFEGNRV